MLITARQIRPLRTAAPDFEDTEQLKKTMKGLRKKRHPLFLTARDLEAVFRWKLGSQYGRQKTLRGSNSDSTYRAVTRAAFAVKSDDRDNELVVRTGVLVALRGVGVPVASAILALADPDSYCVIDFRGWRAAYGELRRDFSIPQYRRYRNDVTALANRLRWSTQETDLAIWELDRRANP